MWPESLSLGLLLMVAYYPSDTHKTSNKDLMNGCQHSAQDQSMATYLIQSKNKDYTGIQKTLHLLLLLY